eukprot:PRCOL_00003442-RA
MAGSAGSDGRLTAAVGADAASDRATVGTVSCDVVKADASTASASTSGPPELYGKFTWKIDKFSEISKRELRSSMFKVGGFHWYILVYPHGCDVSDHLSLFLCVADYDKLLPGWTHFAQFTIAVVNRDPKKSKYSDTLHRFSKKEHDWGWKKFMSLDKLADGFTVSDTLVIKAQVQVIKEASASPFRCLDAQYRRELVRVYLTNVEGICRRFVEERRTELARMARTADAGFRSYWGTAEGDRQRRSTAESRAGVLKAIVKRFFNEKEVTSTLLMDALCSGVSALLPLEEAEVARAAQEEARAAALEALAADVEATPMSEMTDASRDERLRALEGAALPPLANLVGTTGPGGDFVLAVDVLSALEVGVSASLPPAPEDKVDSPERDDARLAELGRCLC